MSPEERAKTMVDWMQRAFGEFFQPELVTLSIKQKLVSMQLEAIDQRLLGFAPAELVDILDAVERIFEEPVTPAKKKPKHVSTGPR